jgi:hypothetical protein
MTPAPAVAMLEAAKPLGANVMGETTARIGAGGTIELVDERMVKIAGATLMTPDDAAFLARSLLSCAVRLIFDKSVKVGTLCADCHFPVLKWVVSTQTGTGLPVVIFSIPPGIDLTFQLSPPFEKALGTALAAHAAGDQSPEPPPDRVH